MPLTVSENQMQYHLRNLNMHKPSEMYSRVLKESADVVAKPLSMALKSHDRQIPSDWKKGRKEDPENNQPVILSSVLSKITKQIFLVNTSQHLENRESIRTEGQIIPD